MSNFKKKGE